MCIRDRVERRDDVVGNAEHLGGFPDGALGAIGNDGGGEPGPFAPVLMVDVLHYLFAPLMLEIDVDIGRLLALARHETLEEQFMLDPVSYTHRDVYKRQGRHMTTICTRRSQR